MRKSLLAMVSVVTAAALAGCGAAPTATTGTPQPAEQSASASEKPKVFTTIYPLEYVTKRIGGEHVEVINIVPPGVEPHDFEPTAKNMVALTEADFFVYNGSGLELWVDKAVENLDKNRTQIINTTEGLNLLKAGEHGDDHADEHADEHKEEHADDHGHDHDHDHGEFDPHVWLDPTLLKEQADKVKQALVSKDQAHAADFEKNYEQLATDLDQLDKEFKEMVAQASRKEFMVSHSAFYYLAHQYGLEQVAISGVNPADEPSPAEMKKLVEHVKEHQLPYVLFETLVSPKVAEVIAKEADVKTATLNPLEGLTQEDVQAGKDYMSIMRENLETLREALK
ncbi:zinc ABC transporter substrate-binding protein [Brevibacillus invocatus]|uniref:Zinc ABC transporter substrate-binding protein n=1 Tax=Brevibacillus invocatus TaxID=173959 RepID=A0A3M8CQQ4_9BACL|nr:metal ABC transporter substrate-binding protein [Brevibacillus invocatus]RNB77225.1 zinc ABC transporter substrate-binding protein [Brevibacillus invocatus]